MSVYMSQSLLGKINPNLLEANFLFLTINGNTIKLKAFEKKENFILLTFESNLSIATSLLTKIVDIQAISASWGHNMKFKDYEVVSLKHFLENDMDSYILKLQLIFEV